MNGEVPSRVLAADQRREFRDLMARGSLGCPVTYVVRFDRIGRTHNPATLTVECATAADTDGLAPDELLTAIRSYARRFCHSREIDVMATVAGDENGGPRGFVLAGGVSNAGSFTLDLLDGVA